MKILQLNLQALSLTLFFAPGLIDTFMALHFRNGETVVDAIHKSAFT
jgi:hypothetical protein